MLNEDKVKLMTKMAIYEKRFGKKNMKMTEYFRGDYVSWNAVKTVIAVTIAYVLIVAAWVFYHIEELIENVYTMDIVGLLKKIGVNYIIILGIYVMIAYIIYNVKYSKAMNSLKHYRTNLKKAKQMDTEDVKGRGF